METKIATPTREVIGTALAYRRVKLDLAILKPVARDGSY